MSRGGRWRFVALLSVLTAGCGYFGDFSVYTSSEGDGMAYVFNTRGGFKKSDSAWRCGADEGSYPYYYYLTVRAGDGGFVHLTPFDLVVPMDLRAERWGDEDVDCVARPKANGGGVKLATCSFKPSGRRTEFEFSRDRGIVQFKAECILADGVCTYRLSRGKGLFAPGTRLEQVGWE